MWFDAKTGRPAANAAGADVAWPGATAVYGPHAVGAWPKREGRASAKAVAAAHVNADASLLAVGGDDGVQVKLEEGVVI